MEDTTERDRESKKKETESGIENDDKVQQQQQCGVDIKAFWPCVLFLLEFVFRFLNYFFLLFFNGGAPSRQRESVTPTAPLIERLQGKKL